MFLVTRVDAPKLKLLLEKLSLRLSVESWESRHIVPQIIDDTQKRVAVSIDENLTEPVFLDVVSSGKHSLHERPFDLAQNFAARFDLMSAADVQAYDLLFVICSDPTLDHGLFFFPSNLVGKNVLFILLHVSVQLLVV